MNQSTIRMGGLVARVLDALPNGKSPELAVVLCHGFGAGGDDLVPIGQLLLQEHEALAACARFYFPAAPLDLAEHGMPGARAWWMIDMAELQLAKMEGVERRPMRTQCPEGLPQARVAMMEVLGEVQRQTGLGPARTVLGGFSQGAMLATDVAMHLDSRVAGLVAWSGTLLNETEWRRLGPRHAGMRAVQSHGRQDPLLSFAWAEQLRDTLGEIGMTVEFLPFAGGHTISQQALDRATALMLDCCKGC